MKYFTVVSLFIILPVVVFSQSPWRNGTIILRNGTTLEGQINDEEWEYAPKAVEFRTGDQAIQKFSVQEVVSFATDRPVLYESHTISYDADAQDIRNLTKSKESTNVVNETIFLEVKVNAAIGLLYMKSRNGRLHYFIKQDTTVVELLDRAYLSSTDNISILKNQKYKQQLIVITNGCPVIQSRLKNLAYDESRLESVFKQINACRNNEVYPLYKGEASHERKKSSYGINIQTLMASCNLPYYYHLPAKDIQFGGGLFWELYSKKRPNRLSLYNELSYKKIASENGTSYVGRNGDFECNKFKLIHAVKVSSPTKSGGRFYAGLGLNHGLRTNTVISGRSEVLKNNNYEDLSKSYEIGFSAMLGHSFMLFQTIKISPELRYDYEYDIANLFVFSTYSFNLQIGKK